MFQNKTFWWVLLLLWCGGSTWWHVCKVKELCTGAPVAAVTMPEMPPAPSYIVPSLTISDGEHFSVSSAGNFGFKKSGVDANMNLVKPSLDSLVVFLKKNPHKTTTIKGLYASTELNPSKFTDLGLARADGIKQYLIKQGVLANQLQTASQLTDLTFSLSDSTHGCLQFAFATKSTDEDSKAAEKLAAEETYQDIFKPMDLYFRTGSSAYIVTEANKKFLVEGKKYLEAHPNKKLYLIGHTDNVGADNLNLRLSEKRANATKDSFVKYGIATSQLKATGKGETQPHADNNTVDGRRANRRVEIVIK
jgi:OmpA-OmpF porin, OOP family